MTEKNKKLGREELLEIVCDSISNARFDLKNSQDDIHIPQNEVDESLQKLRQAEKQIIELLQRSGGNK